MKRIWICVLFTAALLLLPASATAQEETDYTSAADIESAQQLLPQLAQETCDPGEDVRTGDKGDTDLRFLTGRLLVQSGHVPETYGATDVWPLGPDQTVLEYSSAGEAEAAFMKLKKQYECYPDEVLLIEGSETGNGEETDPYMGMSALRATPLGRDVTVAVLDTGIDGSDPWFAKDGTPGGRISEASYDFIAKSAQLQDGDKTKTHKGHGTLVAGTIAERTPDNADIMALRIQSGGETSEGKMTTLLLVGSAMRYALANGADIINMSFELNPVSGSVSALNYLDGIIEDAWEQGVPCCVAAGNGDRGHGHEVRSSEYPACVSTAVTVGSVSADGMPSEFSNYGSAIDFTAPGELDQAREGTSFSAPGIAACFAYLKGNAPDADSLTADALYETLRGLCADRGDTGWDDHYGWGIPDMKDLAAASDHHYIRTITQAATCSEDGAAAYRCSDEGCDAFYEETIPKTGHTWEAADESGQLIFRCGNQGCGAVIDSGELTGKLAGGLSWSVVKNGVNDSEIPVAQLRISGSGSLPKMETYPWAGCSDYITQILIEDGVTAIPAGAFRAMKVLGSVAHTDDMMDGRAREGLPEGLTGIGSNAFQGCSSLKQILIGKNVAMIGEGAFAGCLRLREITVDRENTAFAAENGCLYNRDQTELLFCTDPEGDYEDTVTVIAPQAFRGQQITHVEIKGNVTSIGAGAFAGCGHLRSVNFSGAAERSIGAEAFKQVNAEVYVPEDASGGWMGENYGGTLRWHETNLNENSVTATLDKTSWVYNREEIRPAVIVKTKEGDALTEDVDYTLSYTGNLEPGTGQVKIIGTDRGWSGVVTRSFQIEKAVFSFNNLQVPDTIHAGQELIVTYKGTPIKDMPDLEVEYTSDPKGMFRLAETEKNGNQLLAGKKRTGILIITANTNDYYTADITNEYPITVLACRDGKHSWNQGKVTRKATYTRPGQRVYTCSTCGQTRTSSIPQLKGAAVGTKHKRGSLTYKVRSGSVLQVTASRNVKSVTIPKTVTINKKTYKVTSIGAKTFYRKSKLKTITIRSKTIKSVGKNAFGKLPKKAMVKVPKAKLKTYRAMVRKAGFKGKKQKVKAF